jgi:hypothetical protein
MQAERVTDMIHTMCNAAHSFAYSIPFDSPPSPLILALQQHIQAVYEQAMDITSHVMLILRLIANLEPTSNLNLSSIKPKIISDKHMDKEIKT